MRCTLNLVPFFPAIPPRVYSWTFQATANPMVLQPCSLTLICCACTRSTTKAPLAVNVERLATAYAMGDASFPECLEMQQDESSWLHLIPRPYPSGTPAQLPSGA